MVAPIVLIQAFGFGESPPEQISHDSPRSMLREDPPGALHSPAGVGAPLERTTSRHSFISRLSHPLSRVHSRKSHEFDPEDHRHHHEHLDNDEDAIREQEEEAEAEADLDAAEDEDLEREGQAKKPPGREMFRTNTQVAFEEQDRGLNFSGGRGGAARFRRTNTMDSGFTTSTRSSWASNQHIGALRGMLRRLRYFVFQTGPDHPTIDFIPNYRYA